MSKLRRNGFEYVLARIKFDFKGRYVSDNLPFDLGDEPLQWVALSGSDLTEYEQRVSDGSQARTGRQDKTRKFDGRLGCLCRPAERQQAGNGV